MAFKAFRRRVPSVKSISVKPAVSSPVGQLLLLVMVSRQVGLPRLARGSPETRVGVGPVVAVGGTLVGVAVGGTWVDVADGAGWVGFTVGAWVGAWVG